MDLIEPRELRLRDSFTLEITRIAAPVMRARIYARAGKIRKVSELERARLAARYMRAWRRDYFNGYRRFQRISFMLLVIETSLVFTPMAVIMEWFPSIKLSNWLTMPIIVVTFAFMGASFLAMSLDKRSEYASRYARRSDFVFVSLFRLVVDFDSRASDWTDRSITRQLRYFLISTASEIEMSRMRLTRTQWGERGLRRRIRTENKRIGAAVRSHADALALAGTQGDFEEIRDSLYRALECAAEDDWDSLIDSTPEVSHLPYWAAFLLRLTPGLTVASAAFMLPLIPGLEDSGIPIRNYLLPIAAIMLIGANETVLGSVRAVLDKVAFAGAGK